MRKFEGLTVLVTGASGGFGRRAAERFAAQGARLVLSDLDEDRLRQTADALDAECAILAGDISNEQLSKDLVALAIAHFGRLDVALNNAGIVHEMSKLPRVPADVVRKVIEVDLIGMIFAMQYQLPAMERQFRSNGSRSSIVNIASVAGIAGAPRLAVYSAAKHGVVGLTRSAAAEYATKGIRINAVCPSFARTPMVTDSMRGTPEECSTAEIELTRGVPMKRLAEVDEVVEVILFAADPANSFMTGQTLAADGGITAV